MRIALLGTRGVPARYGGLEVAAEEIGRRLVERGHEVLVHGRPGGADGADPGSHHLGMERVVVRAPRLGRADTVAHALAGAADLVRRSRSGRGVDAAVVLNAANAPVLPVLRAAGVPHAFVVDGLDGKRARWGAAGERYYRICERVAATSRAALVADSVGMQDYYRRRHGVTTVYVPHGATLVEDAPLHRLAEVGLEPGGYHLVRSRIVPENQTDVLVRGYSRSAARLPLVVVGEPTRHEGVFGARVHALAAADPRVRLLGPVWDEGLVDALYAGAASYLHGHLLGGTSPALLRAMGAGAPVVAADTVVTREVVGGAGRYVRDVRDVAAAVEQVEADPAAARARGLAGRDDAARRYRWDDVATAWEHLCARLAGRPAPALSVPAVLGVAAV